MESKMEARNKRISSILPSQLPAYRQNTVKSSTSMVLSSKPPIKSRKSANISSTNLATPTRPMTVAASNSVSQRNLPVHRTDQAKTNDRAKFADKKNIPVTPLKATPSRKATKLHTPGTIPKYLVKQKQWSMSKDPNAALQGVVPTQEKSPPLLDSSEPSPVINEAQLDAEYFKQYSKKLEKRVSELLDELGAREKRISILQTKLRTAMNQMELLQKAVRRTV